MMTWSSRISGWHAGAAFIALVAMAPVSAWARPEVPTRANRLPPGLLLEEDSARPLLPQGTPLRLVSAAGLALTEASEGWEARLYNDAAGYCTIGYGHLIKKARCNGTEPPEFLRGLTKAQGAALLSNDLRAAEITVMTSVTKSLTDAQYSAIVDFVFNVGGANFRSSTVLKRLNEGRFEEIPSQLRRWARAGGKVYPGLVARRNREIALFFTGQLVPKPLPSQDENLSPIDIRIGEARRR